MMDVEKAAKQQCKHPDDRYYPFGRITMGMTRREYDEMAKRQHEAFGIRTSEEIAEDQRKACGLW